MADRSKATNARAREARKREPEPATVSKRSEPEPARSAAPVASLAEPKEFAAKQETAAKNNTVAERRDAASQEPKDKHCNEACAQSGGETVKNTDTTPLGTIAQTVQPVPVAAATLNPELVSAQFATLLANPDGEPAATETTPEGDAEALAIAGTPGVAAAATPALVATNTPNLTAQSTPGGLTETTPDKGAVTGVSTSAVSLGTSAGKALEEAKTPATNAASTPSDEKLKTASTDISTKDTALATRGGAQELASVVDQLKVTAPAPSAPAPSAAAPVLAEAENAAKPADPAKAMVQADAPVPLHAMAVEIGMRAMRGSKEFAIRLDPEDLGRVDIKLEISEAGQIKAKLVVDRVETLQLLQRDARTLERAFEQAGLKANTDDLQFSLRDPSQQDRNANRDQNADRSNAHIKDNSTPAMDEITLRPAIFRSAATRGLDIRI